MHTPLTPTRHDPAGAPDPWRLASSRAAHPSSSDGGEAPLVAAIAEGLAAVSVPWELGTGTTPTERAYELLLATTHYDAWLIHWPAGTGLDAHDHGGSAGAFSVVDGIIDEDVVAPDGTIATRRLGAGETVAFGPEHVHAVVNRGATGVTTVHVYSPPITTMGFHGDEAGRTAPGADGSWDTEAWEIRAVQRPAGAPRADLGEVA